MEPFSHKIRVGKHGYLGSYVGFGSFVDIIVDCRRQGTIPLDSLEEYKRSSAGDVADASADELMSKIQETKWSTRRELVTSMY